MSGNQPGKREREKAKRERAERKRERRETRRSESDAAADTVVSTTSQDEVLTALAALHDAHESGRIGFEDFEAAKADLISRLQL